MNNKFSLNIKLIRGVTFILFIIMTYICFKLIYTLPLSSDHLDNISHVILKSKIVISILLFVIFILVINIINTKQVFSKNEKFYIDNIKDILKGTDYAVFIHKEDICVYANNLGKLMLGYTIEDDLKGKSIFSFTPFEYYNSIKLLFKKEKNFTLTDSLDSKFIDKKGNKFSVRLFGSRLNNSSLCITVAINSEKSTKNNVLREYTELKEKVNSHKYKLDIYSNLSHDMKTPLNIILSSIQVIEFKLLNSDSSCTSNAILKNIRIIEQNSYRLLKFINNLLDINKLDSGNAELNLTYGNIVETIETVTLSIIPYIENKGLRLIFDTSDEEICTSYDSDYIDRILLNLLSNAVKYTPKSGVIYVNVIKKDNTVILSVKDTGCGIPEDKLDLIFERFKQANCLTIDKNRGTGIGLSLVKSLVELHHGNISVKSHCGEGSEFVITLPLTDKAKNIHNNEFQDKNLANSYMQNINIELSDLGK